jgi:small subunit ribosomal protein S16
MIAIKLRPVGKKKQITYRIVVLPKKSKLVGEYIDDLGWYNPHTDKFLVNAEKTKQWLVKGAQPTDTVHNILVTAKIIEGPKIRLQKKSKQESKIQAAPAAPVSETSSPAEESPEAVQ